MPFGLSRLAGTMLLAKGRLFRGSFTGMAFPKNVLVGESNSLKSPPRMASDGTIPVLATDWWYEIHSSETKKKSFSRLVLKWPGTKAGPPMVNPGW